MDASSVLNNFLNPAILFFFLGLIAVFIKSDLEIPQPISKFFSLYLLLAIGFKGGVELGHSGIGSEVVISLGVAVLMSIIVPFYTFFILKTKLSIDNAGAIAATYGSVSAVTFITASAYLSDMQITFGGHMVAAMALMESPAIVIGVFLIQLFSTSKDKKAEGRSRSRFRKILREAFTNGSVVMILGSLLVGLLSEAQKAEEIMPFTDTIFKGMLTFFLLDMGILAGKRIRALRKAGVFLTTFAIFIPILNAGISILFAWWAGLGVGDSLLITVLGASASYIAVPAAMRMAVPEANAGLYVPMSLAITFPFNIIIGIPAYLSIIQYLN